MNHKLLAAIGVIVFLAVAAGLYWRGGLKVAASSSDLLIQASAAEIKTAIQKEQASLTLVNFWASWCEPCKLEFPMILELQKKFAGRGLKVLFVSIDDTADIPSAELFLRSQKEPVRSFVKGEQSLTFVTDLFPPWKGAVPMTLLFGPDLKIVDSWEGDATLEEFQKRVEPFLKAGA